MTDAAIGGIAIGGFFGLIILGVLVRILVKRRRVVWG
jgi:hypothetical protein